MIHLADLATLRSAVLRSAALSVALLAGVCDLARAHGGTYRGPPGPSTPEGPSTPGSGAKGGATTLPNDAQWEIWWMLNWDRLVDLRARIVRGKSGQGGEGPQDDSYQGGKPMTAGEKRERLLPPLLAALRDKDAEVRASAALALGKIALPECGAPLIAALRDRDQSVRNVAALALGFTALPEAEAPLKALLLDGGTPDLTRAWAALGLGYLGTSGAVAELLRQLAPIAGKQIADSNRDVVQACAAGLTVCRDASASPGIIAVLDKAENRMAPAQALLYVALGKLGDPASHAAIARGLKHKDSVVRSGAIAAAGVTGRPMATTLRKPVDAFLADESHNVAHALGLISLGRSGDPAARATLQNEVNHKAGSLGLGAGLSHRRIFGALALGLVGEAADLPLLLHLLDSNIVNERAGAAAAIGILGCRDAAVPLTKAIQKEKNPFVFSHLAFAIGMLRVEGAREHLHKVLATERRLEFRTASAVALGLMGDDKVLDEVLDLFGKVKSAVMLAPLAFAVTLFGDPKAIDQLAKTLRDTTVQDHVRAMCCVALGNMGDTRRWPILSDLAHDLTWLELSPMLTEVVTLY